MNFQLLAQVLQESVQRAVLYHASDTFINVSSQRVMYPRFRVDVRDATALLPKRLSIRIMDTWTTVEVNVPVVEIEA